LPGGLIASITLATTPEQDQQILAFVRQRTDDPRRYFLGGRNCGNFVQDALQSAGIDPIGFDVVIPQSLFDALQKSPLVVILPPY
jgi:hypothetical protein